MTIKEYGVLKNTILVSLINEMDKLIEEGWQPLGGIAVTYGKLSASGDASDTGMPAVLYAQAIVKEQNDNNRSAG